MSQNKPKSLFISFLFRPAFKLCLMTGLALSLTACDLPALDFNKAKTEKTETQAPITIDNPYDGLAAFEPFPNSPTGALGLNVAKYLDNEPQTVEARLSRLENAVAGIQKDLARLAPVIQRLAVIPPAVNPEPMLPDTVKGGDPFRDMPLEQPQTGATAPPQALGAPAQPPAAQQPQATPPVQDTQQAAPAPKAEAKPEPAKTRPLKRDIDRSGPPAVKRLRLGEHGNKTRMVLDLTKKAEYSYDIDTMEDLLIIELPGVEWTARRDWKAKDHPLISSYTASDIDGGTRLIVGLKNDARVIKELAIVPNSSPYYRIVLDLGR